MISIEQKQGFIVDMRKGTILTIPAEEPEQGVEYPPGHEFAPAYYDLSDCHARTVTRVSTHTFGRAYPRVCNVPIYNGDYLATIPKAALKEAGSNWLGVKVGYEPDGMDIYGFRFQPKWDYTAAVCQGEPVVATGVPAIYDGEHLAELGTNYYPWIEDIDIEPASGFLKPGGYQYCLIYEWHDARGRIHRSAPSPIRSVTTEDGDAVILKAPTLQLTEKEDPESDQWRVEIVLFRTVVDGSTFFRVSDILNDKTVPYVYFTDQSSDVTIRENEILYTDGGILPNFQPPAVKNIVHHDSRLWGISADDPTLLFVSKQVNPGFEIPGFPLGFIIQHDVEGPHIALASLGSQIIAFKEEGVFGYGGSAPNDLGQNGTISGPHTLSKSTGCINPKSVVSTPSGVAFQSRESFWMVDRSHQVSRIGGPIEDFLIEFPRCRCSVLDQSRELVYFYMDRGPSGIFTSAMGAGRVLCYHYLLNEWSVWSLGLVEGADVCYRPSLGRFEVTMASDGAVSTLGDGYDYGSMIISTPWLQFSGLAGFQRAKRFAIRGTKVGRFGMKVRIYSDFDNVFFEEHVLTQAEVDALTTASNKEVHARFHVGHGMQKCKAIRVEIETYSQTPDTGGMVRWETIAFELAGKKGLFKLPLAASR